MDETSTDDEMIQRVKFAIFQCLSMIQPGLHHCHVCGTLTHPDIARNLVQTDMTPERGEGICPESPCGWAAHLCTEKSQITALSERHKGT